jgi:hypothetical protein
VKTRVLLYGVIPLAALLLMDCLKGGRLGQGQAVITIDPVVKYQTITGWEATAQAGQIECSVDPATGKYDPRFYDLYKDVLFDQAAADGINRLRIGLNSGEENPVDYFTQFVNGQITRAEWAAHWHEIINDNDDPFSINPAGFQFSALDHKVETVVLPLKQRLEAGGERLFTNVNYTDFAGSAFEHKDAPEEYAEFVLATVEHLQSKYGWIPDAWEVILEPDTSAAWSATQIGQAVAAAGARLKANGIKMAFIAPSTTSMANAPAYFDGIIQVPGALGYLSELSYHRYRGVSDANLRAIATRAVQYGLATAMLEHIGSSYQDLHQDLKVGRNVSWQQFALGYCTDDNGAQYYLVDNTDPAHPQVRIASRTKLLRQYFRYIRRGAVRIEATTSDAGFDPLAFINTNGAYVVVLEASAAGSFSIQGLPAATYGLQYTTQNQDGVNLPDVTLVGGQSLEASIPEAGVITVYGQSVTPAPEPWSRWHYLPLTMAGTR